ncbi:FAD-binding domain-containing protein [Aliiruegeria sabulilitoris]|uniref:FAD-binding domain-containing protein n=1 Tax=Aliiruegeria sabulilitoris TaxID=1510458 RepID=UPI00082E196B|nr:FAD-binding domain-containing protein [Aliiruegeria sabulilitoris]
MSFQTDLFASVQGNRQSGLHLLDAFRPRMGKRYAAQRNMDAGPGNHRAVSRLSPFIRRRLVTEQETVIAAVRAHGPEEASKFIEEVFWRSYFKGWLERRPSVWAAYCTGLEQDLAQSRSDERRWASVEAAETGATGIACFDFWAQELVETGYLHNHARMWFASIWIFTLRLPWRIGADFFLRHLIDGDPAANTLGWRWVAGLHTRGKAYEAKAWNIEKFSGGRFTPTVSELSSNVVSLVAEEPGGLPRPGPLRPVRTATPGTPTALLITEEDCRPEEFDLSTFDIRACATLAGSPLRSSRPVSRAVAEFERTALEDAAARVGRPADALDAANGADLAGWAVSNGVKQVVTPYIPEGPLRDWLRPHLAALDANDIAFCELRRDWDSAVWPYATASFFKVKDRIPEILESTGVSK